MRTPRRRRDRLRLRGYDYSQVGCYFITICTRHMIDRFGHLQIGMVALNEAGCMVWKWYDRLEEKFPNIRCHEMIVMPDHVHFILEIKEQDGKVSIPGILQWFKTMTTNDYIKGVKTKGWPPFTKRLWHRNYHDIIIRTERAFGNISNYIRENPRKSKDQT